MDCKGANSRTAAYDPFANAGKGQRLAGGSAQVMPEMPVIPPDEVLMEQAGGDPELAMALAASLQESARYSLTQCNCAMRMVAGSIWSLA